MGVGPDKIALAAFSISPGAAGGLSVPARRSVSYPGTWCRAAAGIDLRFGASGPRHAAHEQRRERRGGSRLEQQRRTPRSGPDRTSWRLRTAGTHRGRRPPAVNSTHRREGPAGDARHGRPSTVAVTPFSEVTATRGLYTKSGTNGPARAARPGGLAPGHLRGPAGPHVGNHDLLA